MRKKEFAAAVFDPKHETFVIYVTSLSSAAFLSSALFPSSTPLDIDIHLSRKPQIIGLIVEKAPTKIPNEYVNFANVFFPDLASKLSMYTEINSYAIKLVDDQQSPYELIYSLKAVELETLKAYINTNLANGFIKSFKLLANALILFDQKLNSFFRLCVDYKSLNNFIIKNRYLLPLVKK